MKKNTIDIISNYTNNEYIQVYKNPFYSYQADLLEEIKDYVDGFMLRPICLYNNNSITSIYLSLKNKEEVITLFKNEKELGKKVFLYLITETTTFCNVGYAVL